MKNEGNAIPQKKRASLYQRLVFISSQSVYKQINQNWYKKYKHFQSALAEKTAWEARSVL
jgi:hypothetical protein